MLKIIINTAMILMMILSSNFEVIALDIFCEFKDVGWRMEIGFLYSCEVKNIRNTLDDDFNWNEITGNHLSGKNNDDVEGFYLKNVKNLTKFPKNLSEEFPSLKVIQINYCGLTELTYDDLKSFSNLRFLHLAGNYLKTIREDTFKDNLNLEVIILNGNEISHIEKSTFSHLSKLRELWLNKNGICSFAPSRTKVENLIRKIENDDCESMGKATTSSNNLRNLELKNQKQQINYFKGIFNKLKKQNYDLKLQMRTIKGEYAKILKENTRIVNENINLTEQLKIKQYLLAFFSCFWIVLVIFTIYGCYRLSSITNSEKKLPEISKKN